MKKPLIGINCNLAAPKGKPQYRLEELYVESVRKAGGVPALLPLFQNAVDARDFVDRLDGVLLTGGGDIHPRRWGGRRKHPKAKLVQPAKEDSDFHLAKAVVRSKTPALGICLGFQVMSIAMGGTLHQHMADLPGILGAHTRAGTKHVVDLDADSRLADIMGTRTSCVNSYHHQAVERPGRGLRVTSRSADGMIESLEIRDGRFLVGVQWHPERMPDRKDQRRLFQALVAEASR